MLVRFIDCVVALSYPRNRESDVHFFFRAGDVLIDPCKLLSLGSDCSSTHRCLFLVTGRVFLKLFLMLTFDVATNWKVLIHLKIRNK